ncbi:MAG: rod shape-determining protein MreD [Planctomycetaceae bacterium]|nr:rod shape-determining protein MreD [Planctomycetaceae bacterium]
MRLLFLIGLTYLAFVLETAGGTWSLPGSTLPQFMFLAAALGVLWCPGSTAVIWAALCGLLADIVSGAPLGLNVVLLANLAFISQMAGSRQSSAYVFSAAAFVFLFATSAGIASQTLKHVLAGASPGLNLISLASASRAGGTTALFLSAAIVWTLLTRSVRVVLPSRRVASSRPKWAR